MDTSFEEHHYSTAYHELYSSEDYLSDILCDLISHG